MTHNYKSDKSYELRLNCRKILIVLCVTFIGNLKQEDEVLEWLIEQKSKEISRMMIIITGVLFVVTLISVVTIPPDYNYQTQAIVITPVTLPPPRAP